MSFCTKCGHPSIEGNWFCDECGAPLRTAANTTANTVADTGANTHAGSSGAGASTHTQAPFSRKTLFLGAAGLAGLALAGALASLALSNESATPEHLQASVDRYLKTQPALDSDRYCLRNFAYDKDPVQVSGYDGGTQRWMSVLVSAGLYTAPEEVVTGSGFFRTRSLSYGKTAAGRAATAGGALCFASGLVVRKVDSVQELVVDGKPWVRAQVTLGLKDAQPWISSPDAKANIPGRGEDYTQSWDFNPHDRHWEVATPAEVSAAKAQLLAQAQAQGSGHDQGLLGRLLSGLSFAGNPIQGRWSSTFMGLPVEWEFQADSFTPPDKSPPIKVRYEIQGKTVNVLAVDGTDGLEVQVVDDNNIKIIHHGHAITATRMH